MLKVVYNVQIVQKERQDEKMVIATIVHPENTPHMTVVKFANNVV
jgi:hypothetical protein